MLKFCWDSINAQERFCSRYFGLCCAAVSLILTSISISGYTTLAENVELSALHLVLQCIRELKFIVAIMQVVYFCLANKRTLAMWDLPFSILQVR